MNRSKVTVLMPVYNAEKYVAKAIESILDQTFSDFEFLIIDDGSSDKSLDIIKHYASQDQRIKVVSHQTNKGLVWTLNEGLKLAKSEYIARQDADDRSLPQRLAKQVDFLGSHPRVVLVGTNYHAVDESGRLITTTNSFTQHADIKLAMLFTNQFGHGTIMARRQVLLKAGGFDKVFTHAEDYDLWCRIVNDSVVANLPEPLYEWLSNQAGVTAIHAGPMQQGLDKIRQRQFDYFLKNRQHFKLWSFQPWAMRAGLLKYLRKKNVLFRDMAIMYNRDGRRRQAIVSLLHAVVYAPWIIDGYKCLRVALFDRQRFEKFQIKNV